MASSKSNLTRFIPAALGLICAALISITMVTCSGVADRTLSEWIPSDDYGERTYETYTLVSEDADTAPKLSVTPPDWVIGVATDSATEDNPSQSFTHLTYSFETGNVVLTYAADSVNDFLAWQLNEDTIITSHLFGGRYTNIEVGEPMQTKLGGHDVTWGVYAFDNEYQRRNVCYVSAAEIADGQVLTVVASEELRDEGSELFLSDTILDELWSGISW